MGFWPVVENVIRNSDILLLILDARMPELSVNKELIRKAEQLGKELVYVYTKIDLLNEESLSKLKKENKYAFFVSGTKNLGINKLRTHLHVLSKRLNIPAPRIGVIGYPNLGKSAVINALARRARALISDKPGTTRGVQWIKVRNLMILDSPGVIPYEDKSSKLLLLGSKHAGQTNNPEKVAMDILKMFADKKEVLVEKYGISFDTFDAYDILLKIGEKRGFLKKGRVVDETKTAISVIQDWQKGKLKL